MNYQEQERRIAGNKSQEENNEGERPIRFKENEQLMMILARRSNNK